MIVVHIILAVFIALFGSTVLILLTLGVGGWLSAWSADRIARRRGRGRSGRNRFS
jgi:hypothetical protein